MKKVINQNFVIKLSLFLISLLFLILAFERENYWIFGLVALVPFLLLLENLKSWKSSFLISWLWGMIFFLIAFRWILAIFPNETMGLNSDLGGAFLVFCAWFLLSFFIASGFGIFGSVVKKFLNKNLKFLSLVILISSIWIIAEYLRAWIFSLVTWGQGASLGPFYTFGHLGYLLADTPLFYFARIGGLYGLSFLVVVINMIIYFLIKQKSFAHITLIIIFIFLSSYFYTQQTEKYIANNNNPSMRVLLLNLPFGVDIFYREGFLKLLEEQSFTTENQPDIVVFPENFPLLSISGELEKIVLQKLFPNKEKEGFVIANKMIYKDAKRISEIVYRDSKGNLITSQEKAFLIPGGETLPVAMKIIAKISGKEKRLEVFSQNREMAKGKKSDKAVLLGNIKTGSLLCSGILSPYFIRNLTRDSAQIITNSASYYLWKGHPRIEKDLELMAQFNAVANNRPIVESINGGQARIIDNRGIVVKKGSSEKAEILLAEIYPQNKKTFATSIGDIPIIFLSSLVVLIFFLKNKKFYVSQPQM